MTLLVLKNLEQLFGSRDMAFGRLKTALENHRMFTCMGCDGTKVNNRGTKCRMCA